MLYSFHIFNRYGDCIFTTTWKRDSPEQEGECKLVGGLIYSLQQVMKQLSTSNALAYNSIAGLSSPNTATPPTLSNVSSSCGMYRALHTSHYKLHYYETVTGYRLSLATGLQFSTEEGQKLLDEIYRSVFVEFVVRDVRYKHAEGSMITTPQFASELNRMLRDRRLI